MLRSLMDETNRPDAILCSNDLVATGILSEARRQKLDVPGDLAIVGFDNSELSQTLGITNHSESDFGPSGERFSSSSSSAAWEGYGAAATIVYIGRTGDNLVCPIVIVLPGQKGAFQIFVV